jgi:LmbE family N-acetylglucosaminyl deacetylase
VSPYAHTFRPRAPYTGDDLLQDLESIMVLARPTAVLTHHARDRHSDHQALNLLAREAVLSLEQQRKLLRPLFFTYLVHAWDYPRPLRYAPELPLLPPKSMLNGEQWLRFDLTSRELTAKQEAMRDYRTQLDSPYLRLLLYSFLRQNELFAVTEP